MTASGENNNLPLVSFVIPTLNRAKFLKTSIDLILEERKINYPNLEIIVVDGKSQDDTVSLLKNYGSELAGWISEKDRGPADAFNKGVRRAKGELIRFMSDDDQIIVGHTREMVKYLCLHPDIDVLGGKGEMYFVHEGQVQPLEFLWPQGTVTFEDLADWGKKGYLCPECLFLRRKICEELGSWNPIYSIVCDYEFFLRVAKAKKKIIILDRVIVKRYIHSESNTHKYQNKTFLEGIAAIRRHAGFSKAFAVYWRLRGQSEFVSILSRPFHRLGLHPLILIRKIFRRDHSRNAVAGNENRSQA